MAKNYSPVYWMVCVNGIPMFRGYQSKEKADAKAERWQGSHSGNRGLLKHKDRGDWVEVKRDRAYENEYNERLDEAQRGNPQRYVIQHEPGGL